MDPFASSPLEEGAVIAGDFIIESPLDRGGMGQVYRALQTSTGKPRALKVMHREIAVDPVLQQRFEQEARVGSKIASDHVVEVVAAGVDARLGLPYIVMELLEGSDLRRALDERGAMEKDEIRVVFEQLCHAMAAAHRAGIVHRDLKPENVFLARSRRAGGELFTVKVLDFGIAKLAAEAATRSTRSTVGSPLWMAPEQTEPGRISSSADVWAIGLLAYALFTAKSFWRTANADDGTTAQLLREIVLDPIPSATSRATDQGVLEKLPPDFDRWFAKCVAREPRARFADASVAWKAMRAMFGEKVDDADPFSETIVARSDRPTNETADASRFKPAQAASAPPPDDRAETPAPRSSRPSIGPKETPVATVQPREPQPEPRERGSRAIAIGAAVAIAGVASGVWIARGNHGAAMVTTIAPSASTITESINALPPAPPASSASAPLAPVVASAPLAPSASAPPPIAPSAAKIAVAARAGQDSATATAAPKSVTHGSVGGFTDPTDRKGPVLWKVQDHQVRLFTRLVSNDTNVADAVVRDAIDHTSWEYLRCYARLYGGAKDLPEGVVTVGFDIINQLPRNGTLVSSTMESAAFNSCVVNTLIGEIINAAGPDGKGHAVYAFRFVPMT